MTGVSATGVAVAPVLGSLELVAGVSTCFCDSQQDSLGVIWGRLGNGAPARCRPNKLSSERSVGKPPGRGTLSVEGGITRREQALRVWIYTGLIALSSCKGAQKALMYLLTPSSDSSA